MQNTPRSMSERIALLEPKSAERAAYDAETSDLESRLGGQLDAMAPDDLDPMLSSGLRFAVKATGRKAPLVRGPLLRAISRIAR